MSASVETNTPQGETSTSDDDFVAVRFDYLERLRAELDALNSERRALRDLNAELVAELGFLVGEARRIARAVGEGPARISDIDGLMACCKSASALLRKAKEAK